MSDGVRHDPYAAFRHRDYCLFAGGALLANISHAMQEAAVGWELYERTGSPLPLAIVGLVQSLPVFLLALPAGQAADRFERRRIVLLMQLVMAVASLCLAFLSSVRGPVQAFYLCLFVGACARSFNFPAQLSLLPQLVPLEVFANAVTWRSSGFHLASVLGPVFAGWIIAWQKAAAPVYLTNAVLIFAFVVCLCLIRRRSDAGAAAEPLTLRSMLAGVRFVWNAKVILAAITLDMFAVLFGGATALLPIYARDILQVGPAGYGWMRAMPGIGALVMAFFIAHRPPRRAGRTLLWAVACFGAATIVFGLARWFWLSLWMLYLTGAFDQISVVVRHTLVQVLTPDAMRGRVSAVNSVFITTSNELGAFESGVVAALAGPIFSCLLYT
ncbi:MAG: MFS transporter, partial [Verrucomicrobiae bacterium]|nr:MFS transporter [Verrucomicrobiae bacterium]